MKPGVRHVKRTLKIELVSLFWFLFATASATTAAVGRLQHAKGEEGKKGRRTLSRYVFERRGNETRIQECSEFLEIKLDHNWAWGCRLRLHNDS